MPTKQCQGALLPVTAIADKVGLKLEEIELYGAFKAKVHLQALAARQQRSDGKLILVSAITPTAAGEGKTTMSISLAMGLNRLGRSAVVTLREPSLGPLFGLKGAATGGGQAQVLPAEDINLHFTGDIHAVTAAHNLISAIVDNHIFRRKDPPIDPRRIEWERVLDMDDRALRKVIVGLGGKQDGVPRETSFHITASSEVMAILCLAESYPELKEMLSRILLGYTYKGEPVYVGDLNLAGAVAALLKDALRPNLVQTNEGTPAFVHGGPFANIAQGTCSVVSMKLALKLAEFVVTEAGFGFDLGAEKFFNIVAMKSGLRPQVVALVATVRALKMHGGRRADELHLPDPEAVSKGLENLEKHLDSIAAFQVPVAVAINRFQSDTTEEIAIISEYCRSRKVPAVAVDAFVRGGAGAEALARVVADLACEDRSFRPLYERDTPVEQKIEAVCRRIYGAAHVDFTDKAVDDLEVIRRLGLQSLPICIAKTQKSLSDNPELLGRPKDFLITVRDIRISSGAGFLVPVTGDILLMPGLPKTPVAERVDIDGQGRISGLFEERE